ncbi:MAG: ABC transporter ATP-binding protein [Duncaniella sp.]|nr:ABC transporter ATP-binding protein [Duncaniella sp.]
MMVGLDVTLESLDTGYSRGAEQTVVSRGLSATLPAGRLTCLLGRNGAGKSTLMRTLAGFQKPLAGRILAGGADISGLSALEMARTAGVVLTDRIQARELTVGELVSMGRAPYTDTWGRLSRADREAVARAMEMTGTSDMEGRRVSSLSDGERQRAMIAKALAQDTPVILLDEPTAFLDYPGKVEIMRLLRSLASEAGRTVMLSTHDVELAMQTCHHVWLLSRATGLAEGAPGEIDLNPAFGSDTLRYDRATMTFSIV